MIPEFITAADRLWQRTERRGDTVGEEDAKKKGGKTKEQRVHPSSIKIDKWKNQVEFQFKAMTIAKAYKRNTFNAWMRNIHFNQDAVNEMLLEVIQALKDPARGIYYRMHANRAPEKFVSNDFNF